MVSLLIISCIPTGLFTMYLNLMRSLGFGAMSRRRIHVPFWVMESFEIFHPIYDFNVSWSCTKCPYNINVQNLIPAKSLSIMKVIFVKIEIKV